MASAPVSHAPSLWYWRGINPAIQSTTRLFFRFINDVFASIKSNIQENPQMPYKTIVAQVLPTLGPESPETETIKKVTSMLFLGDPNGTLADLQTHPLDQMYAKVRFKGAAFVQTDFVQESILFKESLFTESINNIIDFDALPQIDNFNYALLRVGDLRGAFVEGVAHPIQLLKTWGYKQVDKPKLGDLVIFKNEGRITHFGITGEKGLIESKWNMATNPFLYTLENAPVEFGAEIGFFRPPSQKELTRVAIQETARHFRPIQEGEV